VVVIPVVVIVVRKTQVILLAIQVMDMKEQIQEAETVSHHRPVLGDTSSEEYQCRVPLEASN
jgi:hypothetical protein